MAIVSTNYAGVPMILADEKSGRWIETGDTVVTFRGDAYVCVGGRAPHKPGSTGKVWCRRGGSETEFYPGVVGAVWCKVKRVEIEA